MLSLLYCKHACLVPCRCSYGKMMMLIMMSSRNIGKYSIGRHHEVHPSRACHSHHEYMHGLLWFRCLFLFRTYEGHREDIQHMAAFPDRQVGAVRTVTFRSGLEQSIAQACCVSCLWQQLACDLFQYLHAYVLVLYMSSCWPLVTMRVVSLYGIYSLGKRG